VLLKQAAGIAKGSEDPKREKVGTVSWSQVENIARMKEQDLNTTDIEAAKRIIAGTARSIGIDVTD
jgi:large subunit ribosomal protein L11